MAERFTDWAAWGSLAEEQLSADARELLEQSRRAPVDRRCVLELLDLYGQTYDMLPPYVRGIVGEIEVGD